MPKKYLLKTFGCAMNIADSSRIKSVLEGLGYQLGSEQDKLDLVLVNTCGIRETAENRAFSYIDRIKKIQPQVRIVLTGCLSQRTDVVTKLKNIVDFFLPISNLPNLALALKQEKIETDYSLDSYRLKYGEEYLRLKAQPEHKFIAYVPIGNGCNNFCSYCVVPYARGREVYRPVAEIITEVKELISLGYKEINLIAQNVNSYQVNSLDFPDLLTKVAQLPGNFILRFSSSHPKDVSSKLLEAMANNTKICPHLHLALQSGANTILQAMNRHYLAEEFLAKVKLARELNPAISITTDIIVGFPGEGEAEFAETVAVFKEAKFDQAYISRYSPRPGTPAYKLKDTVSAKVKAKREQVLEDILTKQLTRKNQAFINKKEIVLVEGKNRKGLYYGKTASFRTVQIVERLLNPKLIGQFVPVRITASSPFGFEAKLI